MEHPVAATAAASPKDGELVQILEFSELSGNFPQAISPSSVIDVHDDADEEEKDYLKEVRELVMSPLTNSDDDSKEERYSRLLQLAHEENFKELEKLNFIYKTRGFDNVGHSIIVVIEDNLIPYLSFVRPERVLLYVIHILESVSPRTYVVMYVPSSSGNPVLFKTSGSAAEKASVYASIADYYALISTAANKLFPKTHIKNLRHFNVFLSKNVSLFWFRMYAGYYFYYTFSTRFWNMLEYVTDLRRIFMYVSPIYFQLPTRIFAQLSGITPVFGVPISSVPTKRDNENDGSEYPAVVFDCFQILDHSVTHPDILSFRVKRRYGSKKSARGFEEEDARAMLSNLITAYNFGESPNLEKVEDSAIIANLLRAYLAELPEALIPSAVMDELISMNGKKELSVEKVSGLIENINPLCRRVIRGVVWFLVKVLQNKKYSRANMNDAVNYLFYTMVKGYEFDVVAPIFKFMCANNECILNEHLEI